MKVTTISKKEFDGLKRLKLGQDVCNSECSFIIYGFKKKKVLNELEEGYFAFKMYTVLC